MRVTLYGRYVVRDEKGRVIKRSPWRRDPLLFNFAGLLAGTFSDHARTNFQPLVLLDGTTWYFPDLFSAASAFARVTCRAGDIGCGIVFGRGTTPVSFTDYRLEARYGTDMLYYGATNLRRASRLDNVAVVEVNRSAIALVDLAVSEVGLIAYHFDSGQVSRLFLIARTVLPSPISLAANQTLTWYYRLRVSM